MPDLDNIREVLREFDLSAGIDVFLIFIVVFSTFRVLSGTRAMTPLRGAVALVLVALLLGRVFDLTVVNFIVRNGLTVLLIAAAVVFQPELRRGLDRLGRTGIREWLRRPAYSGEVIEAVAASAAQLSAARHGALMVIERETGLQDVIESGIVVDARVTPELIEGIFFPNSPLHDMAVVIRDKRVVAARCELPLAHELPRSTRKLGTRHRAAIGITEQTDALSVVVSEETGGISVAYGGKLTHVRDEMGLRSVLRRLLASDGIDGRVSRGARSATV